MAFKTQRLANTFPWWTKLRYDPSSFGSRFFSVFADYFDFEGAELTKLRDHYYLLKYGLGKGNIHTLQLEEADFLTPTIEVGGKVTWNNPTSVVGTISAVPYALSRVESIPELIFPTPTRLTTDSVTVITDFLIYSSTNPSTFNEIAIPDKLIIVISNSTEYTKREQVRNRLASNRHFVFIEGRDINNIEITEHVLVQDDDVYLTNNIFSKIDSVLSDGFNGNIDIYLANATSHITDLYNIGVLPEIEGPLRLSANNFIYGVTTYPYLTYSTNLIKLGVNYRKGNTLPDFENNEIIWQQHLLDVSGIPYNIVDIAIDPNSGRLYTIDTMSFIHVYDHKPGEFSSPTEQTSLTLDSYIDIHPLAPYGQLGQVMRMFTFFRKPKFSVAKVAVYRISPSGVKEYIQSIDHSLTPSTTWGLALFQFTTISPEDKLPHESWKDLTFDSEFTELGQWQFYVATETIVDSTLSYTAVLVDSLNSLVDINTTVLSPTSIHFSHDDKLVVTNAANLYKFNLISDIYIVDPKAQQLFLREAYDSVEVTI